MSLIIAVCSYTDSGQYMSVIEVCEQALSSDPGREDFMRMQITCLISLDKLQTVNRRFTDWSDALYRKYRLKPTEKTLQVYKRAVGEDKTEFLPPN